MSLVDSAASWAFSPKMSFENFRPVDPMPSFNFGTNRNVKCGANQNGNGLALSVYALATFRQKCPLRILARSILVDPMPSFYFAFNFGGHCLAI
jgi:hypothetical protein